MPSDLVQIPFSGGPNETVDPRQLPPGSIISVRNAVYDADGTYQPRFGYTQLPNGPSSVLRLAAYRSELIAIDGSSLWTWNATNGSWVSKDSIQPYTVSRAPLENATSSFQSWAEAVGSGYRVVAWVDSLDSGVRVSVYDTITGAAVLGPLLLAQPVNWLTVRVGIIGTVAVIVAGSSSASPIQIHGWTLQLSPLGSISSNTRLDGSDGIGSSVNAAAFLSTRVAIYYEGSANATAGILRGRSYDTTFTLQATSNLTLANGTYGFATLSANGVTGEQIWVAGSLGHSANATNHSFVVAEDPASLALSAGPFVMGLPAALANSPNEFFGTLDIGIERMVANTVLIAYGWNPTQANVTVPGTLWATFTPAGQLSGTSAGYGASLASAPKYDTISNSCFALLYVPQVVQFSWPGRQMVANVATALTTIGTLNGSYLLATLPVGGASGPPDPMGVIAPQIATISLFPDSVPPRIQSLAAANTYEVIAPTSRLSGRSGLDVITIARGVDSCPTIGREMYGGPGFYDGNLVVETGYLHAPPPFTAADQSGAPTNTFQYVITYAHVDTEGNYEESAPSISVFETSSFSPNVLLTIKPLHMTRKQRTSLNQGRISRVYVIVYRTRALELGDNTLYQLTTAPFPAANAVNPTSDTILITDHNASLSGTALDQLIASRPVLYTVSGELQHDAPETLHACVSHNSRVFGIGTDNRTVWYSQVYSDGVMPAWSLSANFTIDDANEPLTALASLYDKLLIFTRHRVYVVYGDGPSNAGTGAEWSMPPQRIPSTSGCLDVRSIVSTPLGIMFVSERGIEVVGTDLSVQFIGLPVSVTTQSFPICSAATMCPTTSTVRFMFSKSDTLTAQSTGVMVVYDVRRDRWTMHYLTAGGGPGNNANTTIQTASFHPTLGFVEGHNLDGLGAPGTCVISRENTTADATPWLDYGTYFVPLSVQTAWIKSGDLQGYQRIRRIGVLADFHASHGLTLTLDYDYQVTGETYSFSNATIQSFVTGSREQVRVAPQYGKGQAIRLTLASTAPPAAGSGQGCGFIGVVFVLNRKRATYKLLGTAQKG